MSKIKYIHCFGTSYTAGGGFEFESTDLEKRKKLRDFYSGTSERMTEYNFSWPGQLSKLLKSNGYHVEVKNHAKSGYGNERMYRLVYDIIKSKNFNKDEHLFLLEFSSVGRKEFYSTEFNDYLIFNYDVRDITNYDNWQVAHSYFYDDDEKQLKLESIRDKVIDFFKLSIDVKEKEEEVNRNNLFFVNFLEFNKINFLFTECPLYVDADIYLMMYPDVVPLKNMEPKHKIIFKHDSNIYNGFVGYFHSKDLTITRETNGLFNDGHAGLHGNKEIANIVYNDLINRKELNL